MPKWVDTEIDLTTTCRKVLLAVNAMQQAVIIKLHRRIESLEGKATPGEPPRMPSIRPKYGQRLPEDKGPSKPRPRGFARHP